MLRNVGPIGPIRPASLVLLVFVAIIPTARAEVSLMAGQQAKPLNGTFNNVPVLHSNQPEEVAGPGILISTTTGDALAENGQRLNHATYTFNGEFGLHAHHKYHPDAIDRAQNGDRRARLTLAAIAINPNDRDVILRFDRGSVKNSFEAPYQANNLLGVIPQGHRPWNTGPGAATAAQMMRGTLDRKLMEAIKIPGRSRAVIFSTDLPSNGIANALLKGRSDGPFQLAVVAAKNPKTDQDILAVLDSDRLAAGRTYLNKINQIETRSVFSRVGGVAIGDSYQATINHNLLENPLHVPLTTTSRHNFGTGDIQINPLVSRMIDSSLDNVGTYGVRFDLNLNLTGNGPYRLVLSHPTLPGRQFISFRGTISLKSDQGYEELHVGMKSGQSLSLKSIELSPNQTRNIMLSMVYPADATPGHLLSVVPETQLAQLREMEERLDKAKTKALSAPLVVYQPPQADLIPSQLLRNKSPLVKTKQSNDSSKREHRISPPQLPPIAPPAIPLGGWPPASPAIIDTNKPHQIFKNWLKR
jgi:hypothetical protein